MPALLDPLGFQIGSYQASVGSPHISIFNRLGLPVGEIMRDGAIRNQFGVEVGRLGNHDTIFNQLGQQISPVILDSASGGINTAGTGGTPAGVPVRLTKAQVLLSLLEEQVLPPPPVILPPGARITPVPSPAPPPAPPPLEQQHPAQYQRILQFAASTVGLNLPQETAASWASSFLQKLADRDQLARIDAVLQGVLAVYKSLQRVARECLGLYGAAAEEWAFEHLGLEQNADLFIASFNEFLDFARSSSYLNLEPSEARAWAFEQAQRWTPRDLPRLVDPQTLAGRIDQERINLFMQFVRTNMKILKTFYEAQYTEARRAKWLQGGGLSEADARRYVQGLVETRLVELFQ